MHRSQQVNRLLSLVRELMAELETLIEEDDGVVFTLQHIEMVEEIVDLLEEEGYGES